MMIEPRCFSCKHFKTGELGRYTCRAFTELIPDDILMNQNEHSKPVPGQTGDFVYTGPEPDFISPTTMLGE